MSSKAKPMQGRILAHPQDIHCVVYHLVVLVCYGVAFWLWFHPEAAGVTGPWSRVAFVLAAAYLLGWISGVDVGVNFHNHTHRRIFRNRHLNTWFGRLWTFSGGWPSFFWNHAHVVVHHSNVLRQNDWTLPRRRADGSFENIYAYVLFHWPWRYAYYLWKDFTTGRGGARVGRRALRELAIFAALWSIPFWIDWKMGLCLWLLPHWFGNGITMGAGMYVQHAGCVPKSAEEPLAHSTTYLSRFFNLTMFNIGYHVEHHDYPHVHWSELPAFHEKMKPRLIAEGAHVVPYGYYRAASIISSISSRGRGYDRFVKDQAPGFDRDFEPPLERVRRRSHEQGEKEVVLQPTPPPTDEDRADAGREDARGAPRSSAAR